MEEENYKFICVECKQTWEVGVNIPRLSINHWWNCYEQLTSKKVNKTICITCQKKDF